MKYFINLFLILVFFSLCGVKIAQAVSISPTSGTYGVGSTLTFSVIASGVPSNATAVQMRINVPLGATVTSYNPPSGSTWFSSVLGCGPGNSTFTANQVCPDLVKNNPNLVVNGESLGSFTVQFNSPGTYSIARASNNGYLVGSNVVTQTGTIATISIVEGLPASSLNLNWGIFTVIVGAVLIFTGIKIFYTVKKTDEK